jgi:hypothetical protein
MTLSNTLAYYYTATVTAHDKFYSTAANVIKLFTAVSYAFSQ